MAINCNDIQTIADGLIDKFTPCYKLTATDMDTIVELILSVEACVVAGNVNWGGIAGTLASQTDLQSVLDSKEETLGDPSTDGYVLSSTTLGVRSWIQGVSGSTNLSYNPSPINGLVTSDTGNNATLPLANGTNAGLMTPAYFTALGATSGSNSGDNAVNSLYSSLVSNAIHTGDVTGASVLTIGTSVVDLNMLSATGTPTSSNFLRGDNVWGTPAGSGNVSTSGTPVINDFARFIGATDIEGRSYAETRADLSLEIGIDVQAYSVDLDSVANTNTGDNSVNSLYSSLVSNVSTDLSIGTITGTTLDINSSDGVNATIPEASTTEAGLLSSGNWDNIAANNSKVSNVTHTGDVTGDSFLTIATDAVDISMLSAIGTADSTTYLRGDNIWDVIDLSVYNPLFTPPISSNGNYSTANNNVDTKTNVTMTAGDTLSLNSTGLTLGFEQQLFNDTGTDITITSPDTIKGNNVALVNGAFVYYIYVSAGVWEIAVGGAIDSDPKINTQSGTTYSLVDSDKNKTVTLNNAAAITLTVPDTLNLAIGAEINLMQLGAGQVTVVVGGIATVNKHASDTLKLDGQYSVVTLKQTSADIWVLFGRLEAV